MACAVSSRDRRRASSPPSGWRRTVLHSSWLDDARTWPADTSYVWKGGTDRVRCSKWRCRAKASATLARHPGFRIPLRRRGFGSPRREGKESRGLIRILLSCSCAGLPLRSK